MTQRPRTHLDDEVETSIARYPFPMKRALDRLAHAAIDTTVEDRGAIVHYLKGIAELENVPREVAHYLNMAAGIVVTVQGHTAAQYLGRHGVRAPTGDETEGETDA